MLAAGGREPSLCGPLGSELLCAAGLPVGLGVPLRVQGAALLRVSLEVLGPGCCAPGLRPRPDGD